MMKIRFSSVWMSLCVTWLQIISLQAFRSNVHVQQSAVCVSKKSCTNAVFKFRNFSKLNVFNDEEMMDEGTQGSFTQRQILKEESEAPFRTVRIYLYIALLAAASLSAFICLTQILAVYTSNRSGNVDMSNLLTNLAINLGGIPVLAFLWKRDLDARQSKLERIQRGSSLAGLRLKINTENGPSIVKLIDLRRDRGIEKRVVIVVGKKELLTSSIKSSLSFGRALFETDLLVVPLLIDSQTSSSEKFSLTSFNVESAIAFPDGSTVSDNSITNNTGTPSIDKNVFTNHIGIPVFMPSWDEVIRRELSIALKQQPDAINKGKQLFFRRYILLDFLKIIDINLVLLHVGITIVIKKNGKVGLRRFGVPIWEGLVEEVNFRKRNGLDTTNI